MKKFWQSCRSIGVVGFLVIALIVSMATMPVVGAFAADVTLGTGVEALRAYILNGNGDADETWVPFMKAQNGDYKLALSATTAAPTAAALAAAAVEYDITITLSTYDDEVHAWYYGPLGLAIADTCVSVDATITPSTTTPNMTAGVYTVKVTLPKGSYTASEDVTLTVSDPTNGFNGWPLSHLTFVATVN